MAEQARYEVRVRGRLGPAAREAFSDMSVDVEPPATLLSGAMDQHALQDLLNRIHALGLEVAQVRQITTGK